MKFAIEIENENDELASAIDYASCVQFVRQRERNLQSENVIVRQSGGELHVAIAIWVLHHHAQLTLVQRCSALCHPTRHTHPD